MRIRAAKVDDAETLTAIAMEAKAHWGYDDAFMAACRNELTFSADRIRNECIKVAEIDGAAAGFSSLIVATNDHIGEVEDIFVLPKFMGKGVGRRLMKSLESEAIRLGATALEVDADPNALLFYERMGFTKTGQSPSASIPGRYLPRMRKRLAKS